MLIVPSTAMKLTCLQKIVFFILTESSISLSIPNLLQHYFFLIHLVYVTSVNIFTFNI